jgi:hypothetical protein
MIQIEDWVIYLGILILFFLGAIYLIYFIISKKLFPMNMEFQNKVNPDKSTTLLSIDGSGIIKKIEMQVTENDNSWISMIIDGASYENFLITKANNSGKTNLSVQENILINIEVNLDAKFHKNFSLIVQNRSLDKTLDSSGKIFYEIKKPLKVVLKAIYAEITS